MSAAGKTTIVLPFPPASLSGHNKGRWRSKTGVVLKYRSIACKAALDANVVASEEGDIPLSMTFYPPDRRGDRVNFPIRMKPLIDGLADALKVNDSRFLPSYHFGQPTRPGKVVVEIKS